MENSANCGYGEKVEVALELSGEILEQTETLPSLV